MPEQLKINVPDEVTFNTIRTVLSRLWFVNNSRFDEEIKGYLAKYQKEFGVVIYHFIIMGNHYHLIAKFPRGNRHSFMKCFNRIFSNVARRHVPRFKGGPMWARRYRPQALPESADVKHWFFYSALNPIHSGLAKNLSDHNAYNGFHDAISGKPVKCSLVNWHRYQNRKRYKAELRPEDCVEEYELVYTKLPGFEHLSDSEYRSMMRKEFSIRRNDAIEKRRSQGLGFLSPRKAKETIAGEEPKSSKQSSRYSKRPLVLTLSKAARKLYLDWYFSVLLRYRQAVEQFKKGNWSVAFPPGTFSPPCRICNA